MSGPRAFLGALVRLLGAADTPSWTLQAWDDDAETWRNVSEGAIGPVGLTGATGTTGPTGPAGARALSGLLSLPPLARSGILDGAYLATSDTLAVLTAASEPIATQPLRVVSMEERILTAAGDVIVV